MNILKKVGVALLAVIVLLLVVSFFLPSKVNVEREIVINANPSAIFAQLNDFKAWDAWSPWKEADPAMENTLSDITVGVGATSSWTSKINGNGKMEITKSVENEEIETALDFMENGTATGYFKLIPEGEATKVVWGFDSELGMNPIAKYFGLMMDKMVAPDFERGLENLKKLCESIPPAPEVVIESVEIVPFQYISIKDSTTANDIGNKLGELFGELMGYMASNKMEAGGEGNVFSFYHVYSSEKVVLEAGLKVNKPIKPNGRIKFGEVKTGQAALVKYYGAYEGSGVAHEAIEKWMGKNGKASAGNVCWEVYVTDPGAEPDTAKWLTEIWYPIQ